MNSGRYILSQAIELVDRATLSSLAARDGAGERVHHFKCRQQFICMVFAQKTPRDGLRDIATCLNARSAILYHLGFTEPVAKSTLADADEQRVWRIYEKLAESRKAFLILLRKVRFHISETDKEFIFLNNNRTS